MRQGELVHVDEIPSAPLRPEWCSSRAGHRLVEARDRLALRPTVVHEAGFSAFCFAVGGIGLYLFATDGALPMMIFGWVWLIGLSFIGLAVLTIAALRLKYGMRADFDLMSRELRISGSRFPGGAVIPLSDVLAVQVCPGQKVVHSDSFLPPSYRTYEMNITWRDDDKISRLCLCNHGGVKRMRRQAERIAARLGVKLIDLAAEAAASPPPRRAMPRGRRRSDGGVDRPPSAR